MTPIDVVGWGASTLGVVSGVVAILRFTLRQIPDLFDDAGDAVDAVRAFLWKLRGSASDSPGELPATEEPTQSE